MGLVKKKRVVCLFRRFVWVGILGGDRERWKMRTIGVDMIGLDRLFLVGRWRIVDKSTIAKLTRITSKYSSLTLQ